MRILPLFRNTVVTSEIDFHEMTSRDDFKTAVLHRSLVDSDIDGEMLRCEKMMAFKSVKKKREKM